MFPAKGRPAFHDLSAIFIIAEIVNSINKRMMKGMKAEDRVAASLRAKGASVTQSPGSRTSADLIARWPSGKTWFIQVKYSGIGKPAGLSSEERRNLVARAQRNNGVAVYAAVTSEKINYSSVKSERAL